MFQYCKNVGMKVHSQAVLIITRYLALRFICLYKKSTTFIKLAYILIIYGVYVNPYTVT